MNSVVVVSPEMPHSSAANSLRANSQDQDRSAPSDDQARSPVIEELLACRDAIQRAEEGFYEQRRRNFVELYETAYRLVRIPEALRSFMESPEVLNSSARMPRPGATPEQCLVYLVRFAYSGPTKRMQKRASKFAKIAQVFVAAKINPCMASALLEQRSFRDVVEIARRQLAQPQIVKKAEKGALAGVGQLDLFETETQGSSGNDVSGVSLRAAESGTMTDSNVSSAPKHVEGVTSLHQALIEAKIHYGAGSIVIRFKPTQVQALRSADLNQSLTLIIGAAAPGVFNCLEVSGTESISRG